MGLVPATVVLKSPEDDDQNDYDDDSYEEDYNDYNDDMEMADDAHEISEHF